MDGITASVIGSSTVDRSSMASKSQQARKRTENDNRKVEQTTFNIPQY